MLMEKSLSSDRKYWTVRCLLANNHYRHNWSIFYLKKHLAGKLCDVHWQISHWTNKRKQKVVNKSKSWTAIPTQFHETWVYIYIYIYSSQQIKVLNYNSYAVSWNPSVYIYIYSSQQIKVLNCNSYAVSWNPSINIYIYTYILYWHLV